jgi:hypothetical protein
MDRVLQVIGFHLDNDPMVARLNSLRADAEDRIGFRR